MDHFTLDFNITCTFTIICKEEIKRMKKMKTLLSSFAKKPGKTLCTMVIALTPLILVQPSSSFFWGETECPDDLWEAVVTKTKH